MNPSLIALLSIVFGILGAQVWGRFFKSALDLFWTTFSGVFGSILCIKIVGRLGMDPSSIVCQASLVLLMMNLMFSFLGGILGVILFGLFKEKMGETRQKVHKEKR